MVGVDRDSDLHVVVATAFKSILGRSASTASGGGGVRMPLTRAPSRSASPSRSVNSLVNSSSCRSMSSLIAAHRARLDPLRYGTRRPAFWHCLHTEVTPVQSRGVLVERGHRLPLSAPRAALVGWSDQGLVGAQGGVSHRMRALPATAPATFHLSSDLAGSRPARPASPTLWRVHHLVDSSEVGTMLGITSSASRSW